MSRSTFQEDLMRGYIINNLEEYFPRCQLIGAEISLPNKRRCDLVLKSDDDEIVGVEIKSTAPQNWYSYATQISHYISGLRALYKGEIRFAIVVSSEQDHKSLSEFISRYSRPIDVIAINPKRFDSWKHKTGLELEGTDKEVV